MVALNLLSTVLAWMVPAALTLGMPAAALMVIAVLRRRQRALIGLRLMWLLMGDDPARPAGDN
jgi:hypothetical protein